MSYKTYLMNYRKEQIFENYKTLPNETKTLTILEIHKYIKKGRTEKLNINVLDLAKIIKPINDLVMMNGFDFNENLTLEEIVRCLKNI